MIRHLPPHWIEKARQYGGPMLAVIVFGLAIQMLVGELQTIKWTEFKQGFQSIPIGQVIVATFLVAMNYVLLAGYDLLAIRYLRRAIPVRRVLLVSFLGYSLGNNFGTLLAATPIRFRFYLRWGVPPAQILVLVAILGLTFWSGLWFLGGAVLTLVPIELPDGMTPPIGTRWIGVVLLTLGLGYFLACAVWRKPLPFGRLHLRLPAPGLMSCQACVAAVDLFISATALYFVLPGSAEVSFATVMAAYLLGIAASLVLQLPGGLGLLELILLKVLKESAGGGVIASLLVFRCIYYFAPLILGMVLLLAYEIYGGAVEARRAVPDPEGRVDKLE
ncbi:MAG: YbhN family protein [Planctomycetota bacterium]